MAVPVTPEGRVAEALLRHLHAFDEDLYIVPPNVIMPADGATLPDRYVVATVARSAPLQPHIDPTEEHVQRGFLGLGLMVPLGSGEVGSADYAGAIASYFQAAQLSEGSVVLRIVGRPHVAGGYVDGGRWRIPITIEFQTVAT